MGTTRHTLHSELAASRRALSEAALSADPYPTERIRLMDVFAVESAARGKRVFYAAGDPAALERRLRPLLRPGVRAERREDGVALLPERRKR